jgi:competence ComEA-like helix-hairpin-helix protein
MNDLRSLVDRIAAHALPLLHRATPFAAIIVLVIAMAGRWQMASAQPTTVAQQIAATREAPPPKPTKKAGRELLGKLNLNTATEEQLQMLPTVGPSKAERIVTWRKKNGRFKRIADLRRVKGFGFKTFKRLEPFLAIEGETTLQ